MSPEFELGGAVSLSNTELYSPLDGDELRSHSLDLFQTIAEDIEAQGYSIKPAALPEALCVDLVAHVTAMAEHKFVSAGVGRGDDFVQSRFVRSDEICWISGDSEAGQVWLDWAEDLKRYLNRRLLLGLFSFESHFAHYSPGQFYKRHYDAFKGQANRVLSLVVYLNPAWGLEDGGELVLYQNDDDIQGTKVTPLAGTLVAFLSEEFPHEVLPALRDRYSIAAWFRLNTSVASKVDPPR